MGIDGQVVHIEVTPACFAVGVEVASCKAEGFAGPVIDSLVKDIVGIFLYGQGWVFEEGEIFHLGGIIEVDQDAGFFAFFWLENGLKQTDEVK
jgi:hypothetical protein